MGGQQLLLSILGTKNKNSTLFEILSTVLYQQPCPLWSAECSLLRDSGGQFEVLLMIEGQRQTGAAPSCKKWSMNWCASLCQMSTGATTVTLAFKSRLFALWGTRLVIFRFLINCQLSVPFPVVEICNFLDCHDIRDRQHHHLARAGTPPRWKIRPPISKSLRGRCCTLTIH